MQTISSLLIYEQRTSTFSEEEDLQFSTVFRRQRDCQYRQISSPEGCGRCPLTLGLSYRPISDEDEDRSPDIAIYLDGSYSELAAKLSPFEVTDPTYRPWEYQKPVLADSFGAVTENTTLKPANEQGRNLFTLDRYNELIWQPVSPPRKMDYRRRLSPPRTPTLSLLPPSSLVDQDSPSYLKAIRETAGQSRKTRCVRPLSISAGHLREGRRVDALSMSAAGLYRRRSLLQTQSDENEALEDIEVRRPRGCVFNVIETYDERTNIGVPGTWVVEDPVLSSEPALVDVEAIESAARHRAQALAQLESPQFQSVPHIYSREALEPHVMESEVEALRAGHGNIVSNIHQGEFSRPVQSSIGATGKASQTSNRQRKHHHFITKAVRDFSGASACTRNQG